MKNYTKCRRELKEAGWGRSDRTTRNVEGKVVHVEQWLPPWDGTGYAPLAVSYRTARRRYLRDKTSCKIRFVVDERGSVSSCTLSEEGSSRSLAVDCSDGAWIVGGFSGKPAVEVTDEAGVPVEDGLYYVTILPSKTDPIVALRRKNVG